MIKRYDNKVIETNIKDSQKNSIILQTNRLSLKAPDLNSYEKRYLIDQDENLQKYTKLGVLSKKESKALLLEDINHYK